MLNARGRENDELTDFEDLVENTRDYLRDEYPSGFSDAVLITALVETVESNDDIYMPGPTTVGMIKDAFYEILGMRADGIDRFERAIDAMPDPEA